MHDKLQRDSGTEQYWHFGTCGQSESEIVHTDTVHTDYVHTDIVHTNIVVLKCQQCGSHSKTIIERCLSDAKLDLYT